VSKVQGFRFVGPQHIEQVPQPEGTELCFASIVAATTGANIDEADRALRAGELYDDKGQVVPMGEMRLALENARSVLDIDPVVDPFSGDQSEVAMERIDEALVAARAVALLYKKTHNPKDEQHHWTLLTGYLEDDGQKGAYRVMDPLRPRISYLRRELVRDMIERSTGFMGVYAYALSTPEK